MKSYALRFLTAIGAAVILWTTAGRAEEAAAPQLDAKAQQVLKDLDALCRGAKSLRFEVLSTMKMQSEGMNQEFFSKYSLAAERPNRLSLRLLSGMMGATIISDGKDLYAYMPSLKKYTVEKAPEAIEDMAEKLAMGSGLMPVVTSLIAKDPYGELMEGVEKSEYLGEAEVDGVPCHHMKFYQQEFDWEAWVRTGDQPVLIKVKPDFARAMATARGEAAMPADAKMEMSVVITNWSVNGDVPAGTFAFSPPEGAEKVDSFFGDGGEDEEEAPHPLTGKPAPAFTLPLFGGGEFNLADQKGKKVVILDFWATWCGPCRRALPEVIALAADYKDKDVVLIAVNQRESEETVKAFMEKQKISCTVALDVKGEVGNLFEVEGIPQTVVIDKDGVVRVVHIGFAPDLRQTLGKELDAALAGPAPAAPPEAGQKAE